MFEPAYAEYLRKKKANFLEEAASAVAAAAVPSLCPYSELQLACPFDEAGTCEFRHLIQCDQCQRFALDVDNVEQQKAHRAECMRAIEAEMEEVRLEYNIIELGTLLLILFLFLGVCCGG